MDGSTPEFGLEGMDDGTRLVADLAVFTANDLSRGKRIIALLPSRPWELHGLLLTRWIM